MIDVLIALLIKLLVIGLIWWAITSIIKLLPLPPIVLQIVNVLVILIVALAVIYALAPMLMGAGLVLR